MRPYHLSTLALLLIYCQDPPPVAPATNVEDISEQKHFVDSINTHFYKLHSADFKNAEQQTNKAITLSTKNQWPKREALAQKNLGILQYLLGNYQKAQSAYLRSYDLYDSLNDKSGLARVCNEMGNYYRKQGNLDKAMGLWDQAEVFAKEAHDLEALGTAYGMRATTYWVQKDYARSDEYYLKCYAIRLEQNDSVGLSYIYIDLADMERRKGNISQTLSYFEASNSIRERIGDKLGIIDNYKALGDLFMEERAFRKAIPYYLKCVDESTGFSYPDLVRQSYDSLSHAYASLREFEKAYQFQSLAKDLEDSLFTLEKSKVISELETRYETEKKEQHIVLQQAEIAEQEAQNNQKLIFIAGLLAIIMLLVVIFLLVRSRLKKEQLMLKQQGEIQRREAELEASIRSQEKERSRFAKDLHDSFGQMISILNLNLHTLQEANIDRHAVFERSTQVLDEMYGELKSICFNLMPQTLIQHGLGPAIREFAGRINATGKVFVAIDVFGLDKRLSEVHEISLYRIAQEWINNILKYSNADKITIQITRDDSELTLLIEDNGVGFDPELLKRGKGNGWRNMNSRTNLLNGVLELDTKPGVRGSALILNVPVLIEKTHLNVSSRITV